MSTFFTSVNQNVIKITDSISRMLGATLKNDETRAISGTVIRDMRLQASDTQGSTLHTNTQGRTLHTNAQIIWKQQK
jgi:hypothetical protein